MIHKKLLQPQRVRTIQGSFAFIEHRFLRDGFWLSLDHHELLLYLLLVLVADRQGLSYYSYDRLCALLGLSLEDYVTARNSLIEQESLSPHLCASPPPRVSIQQHWGSICAASSATRGSRACSCDGTRFD